MDDLEVRGGYPEGIALELPPYESIRSSPRPPGFTNPRYNEDGQSPVGGDRERGEGEEEGEWEGEWEEEGNVEDIEDLPPPYSPGVIGQQAVFVAPPDYFTIFGQIREAREESTNNFTFLSKLCQIILNTVGCTVLLVVFMSVPITILALGIYFVGDCPAEPNIPIFLIVVGISGALKNIALVFENIVKRMSHHISVESARRLRYVKFTWRAFNLIFDIFLIAWILTGSYWIYHIYEEVDPEYENCHETLYKFAFAVITSSYILFILMCCCMCFCGICIIQRRSGEREDQTDNESREGEGEDDGEMTEGRSRSYTQSFESRSLEHAHHPSPRVEDGDYFEGDDDMEPSDVHRDMSDEYTYSQRGPGSDEGGSSHGRRQAQPPLSLENLEPLEVVDYNCTPILSPRARQLPANEQESPLSPQTTTV